MLASLAKFVNACLAGYLPPEIQPYLCGGRLVPLRKKDEGIRPLVIGELLRAIAAKLSLAEIENCLQALQPLQIGVGSKGPVIPSAILAVKSWIAEMADDEILLKIDIANAYNTIDRQACLAGVAKFCPDLLRWARWCLDGANHVYYDHEVILCSRGVQQGDPLAPMLFSVGLHLVAERLLSMPELRSILFLDDAILRGKVDNVHAAFTMLRKELLKIGLAVSLRKCEIYVPSGRPLSRDFEGITVVADHDQWTYLGSPLFEKSTQCVQSGMARVSKATRAIAQLGDRFPKQAFELLCQTSGACKIEYLLQTLSSLTVRKLLAEQCSHELRAAYALILKVPSIPDCKWTHTTIPRRMGGFGLRDPVSIVESARLASLTNVTERATEGGSTLSWF